MIYSAWCRTNKLASAALGLPELQEYCDAVVSKTREPTVIQNFSWMVVFLAYCKLKACFQNRMPGMPGHHDGLRLTAGTVPSALTH